MRPMIVLPVKTVALVCAVLFLALLPLESFGEQRVEQTVAIEPPMAVKAIPVSVQSVELQWSQAAAEGVYGYTIRRNDALVATLYGDARGYTDAGVQPSTVYTYTVTTLSTNWVDSPPSEPVVIKTPGLPENPDTSPPSSPANLTATLTDEGVLLDWYDASDDTDISAYLIRRDGMQMMLVRPGTLSYIDTTFAPGTTYTYSVVAIDVVGQHSPPSNLATIETEPYPAP